MLTSLSQRPSQLKHTRQKGVVLLITLIMLVAMTLAAIALMRSVDTTNLVAGNLAFQQATYNVADTGTEQAIAYLTSTVPIPACDSTGGGTGVRCPAGYKSFHEAVLEPPTVNAGKTVTWENFWDSMVTSVGVVALTGMPSGFSGAYVIESLCSANQQATCTVASSTTTVSTPEGQDQGSTIIAANSTTTSVVLHYYRITTRVQGPRNSVGFIQTLVVM